MGLTIHYSLASKANSFNQAKTLVRKLREKALTLPFAEMGELLELSGSDADYEKAGKDNPNGWLLIQAGHYITHGRYHHKIAPKELIAFTAVPGDGCEPANFGLCRYPGSVKKVEGSDTVSFRTGLSGWRWHSFCKTQYASRESVPHFLKCHLSVIKMLDYAKELGILEDVSDESDYWTNRDVPALAKQVGEWNEMVAGLFGALKDAFGPDKIESPIQQFQNFEHLEAAVASKLGL